MKFQALSNGLNYERISCGSCRFTSTGQPLTPNRHDANSFLGPGQSSIVYLLMIDMHSGDTTCIHFNNSILKGIILLVGYFHTFMNQLRAIGTLMPGTWP